MIGESHTAADRYSDFSPAVAKLMARAQRDDSFGHVERFLHAGIGHEQDELFSAVAADQCGAFAHVVQHERGELAQNFVARQVAERIIDVFELVQIEKNERQVSAVSPELGELFFHPDFIKSPGVKVGKAVMNDLGKQLRVFQRNGQGGAENSQLLRFEKAEATIRGDFNCNQSHRAQRGPHQRQA